MQLAVDFGEERLDFDLPADRVVGAWAGPRSLPGPELAEAVRTALDTPLEFPPLRQAIVEGDQVAIAVEPDAPGLRVVLEALIDSLLEAGISADAIRIVATGPVADAETGAFLQRAGIPWAVHDPDDRTEIAYLASTVQGRRVYLNRALTDADVVIPIGRLGYEPVLGYRGPWSLLYPGLSDSEIQRAYRAHSTDHRPDRERPRPLLAESAEVSWLLGSQFQIGLLPGVGGLSRVVAGLGSAVQTTGALAIDEAWSLRADQRAELVVAGIGRPGVPARIEDLADGLATASQLVRRGGKIVALSRAVGPIGPALQRLIGSDLPRPGPAALKGAEGEPDYPAARQLVRALAWADVYLLSNLGEDLADDLDLVPLGRPEEARRLAAASESCLFLSQAELFRAEAAEDDEPTSNDGAIA